MLIIPKKRNLPLEVIDTIPKSWKTIDKRLTSGQTHLNFKMAQLAPEVLSVCRNNYQKGNLAP